MAGPERRQQLRERAHAVVTYVSIGKKRVTAALENISGSGVFLRASLGVPPGTRIGLEFFDGESKKTLIVSATVTRVTEPGAGSRQQSVPGVAAKFDELTFDQFRRVGALIDTIGGARGEPVRAEAPASGLAATKRGPPPSGPRPDSRDSGPGIKRRRNRRVPTAKAATAHVKLQGEVVAFSVPVSNVSMGGLFLQTTGKLPIGGAVDLELSLAGKSMVISGQVVGHAGAAPGVVPGISISFGPMPRRIAERLRQALSTHAPLAADGLEQESLPGGYVPEPVAPAPPAAPVQTASARSARSSDFDFGAGELAGDAGEQLLTEDLVSERERLKAEIKVREERIAMIEKTLREPPSS